ncbi:MAG: sulfotransferase [Enhygromyxa sp.]
MWTSKERRLGLPIRIINGIGRGLARVGIEPGEFEVEALLARARAATRLDDFGSLRFCEPLAVLCEDIRAMGRELSTVARIGLVRDIGRSLTNRLRTQALLERHPEIRELPIVEPIFVIGSLRTGTTLLQNLLSRAPGHRSPLMWELLEPAPHIERPAAVVDPRMVNAQKLQAEIERALPGLALAHPMVWDWPEECLWLFANSFLSEMYLTRLPLPRYREMLLRADWSWAVDEYAQALRVLSWQHGETETPPRWVLKAPGHCFRLAELTAAFPDARFLRTHRDPRKTVASTCSLFEYGRIPAYRIDLDQIGREVLATWVDVGLERLVDASEQLDDGRCFDVDFAALMADPFKLIEEMFAHFGFELGSQDRMRQWLDDNPRHARGQHTYTLARYGITESEVLERTSRYRARFGEFLSPLSPAVQD